MRNWLMFNILITFLLMSGCASRKSMAPLVVHDQPPNTKVSYHIVAKGETLYSIAWRYNLDYKTLAESNNVGHSYRIYPGQKIHLKASPRTPWKQKANKNNSQSRLHVETKANTEVVIKSEPKRLTNKTKLAEKSTKGAARQKDSSWSWPVHGRILSRFNSNNGLNKGIDIAGDLREPVRAASSGTVVYSGEGLRGYGKLIIIKHSEKYLSAYAHNHRLLVAEGDEVVRSEKIAEMGSTGAERVKLHFEIRHDGKPVDPLAYLPPK